ncbi:MAG: DNA primase small subunit PriS [Candidatus Bathyarchaeota archaeon]|nr:DNA primase small subunit PriS [Candidatus Bathyarchaeota archaeon]
MLRHKGFVNISNLREFLKKEVPSDVYRSCAYYENPSAEMDKKGWLGADLVFDIDADHIPTSCNKIHDEWTCKKCGLIDKGEPPKQCSRCGGEKFDTKTWVCEQCLGSAKEETAKLIDILQSDFGFSSEEIHVFFSGHRGYHLHVENDAVKSLDTIGRKEIVDYVTGLGLAISKRGRKERKREKASEKFFLSDFAWNKRIKKGMRKFIIAAAKTDLENIGLSKNTIDPILSNKEIILKRCIEDGFWDSVKGVGVQTWKKLAEYIKDLESAKIDTVVTTDTHRLIRMNGTLHGKTGLKKIEFPAKRLADFDPFKEAVAFKEGSVKVFVSDLPEFRLGGSVLGPYEQQKVEIPTAAAVLLICKGRAEVAK